jgi:hypothetical protein
MHKAEGRFLDGYPDEEAARDSLSRAAITLTTE